MKLKSLLMLGLATFALASCDEDFNDWTSQQTNTQGETISFGNGSVSEVAVINMANVADGTDSIQICNITEPTSTYSTTANKYVVDFGDKTYSMDSKGRMKYSDLKTYVESSYGKKPVERDIAATITAYTGDGNTAVKSILTKSDVFNVKVIPASPYIDPNGYYLVGSIDGWSCTKVDAYHLTNSGADVYTDPVFTVTIAAPAYAETYEIKIAPASAWDGSSDGKVANWGNVLSATSGSPETAYSGNFSYTNGGGNIKFAGKSDAKFYVVTINVLDGTYKVSPVEYPTYLYEIGNNTKWSSVLAIYSPNNDGIYTGAFYLKSGFKFRSNHNDWNGFYNLGSNTSHEAGVLVNDGGSGNIEIAEDGFYQVSVDINKMIYTLKPFTSIGIIGDGQPGGWSNDTKMTYDATNMYWYANNVTLVDGSIKFRSDGSWTGVNLGGDFNNLVQGSNDNIKVTAGTYNIKLYLESDVAPHATLEVVK